MVVCMTSVFFEDHYLIQLLALFFNIKSYANFMGFQLSFWGIQEIKQGFLRLNLIIMKLAFKMENGEIKAIITNV